MKILFILIATAAVVSSSPWSSYDRNYWDRKGNKHPLATIEGRKGSGKSTCNCGWANKGRIVGGKETMKNAYPFVVTLELDGEQQCGGTILTERHVLSAAHCTFYFPAKNSTVRVGAHDLAKGQGTVHKVKAFINHEKFDGSTYFNDISIVVLQTPIKFNQNVGPVCLPSKRVSLVNQKIKALGWGTMSNGGPSSNVLREVDLNVISFEKCREAWKSERDHPQKETNLCTFEIKKDTCQQDSGGPLVWLNPSTNRYTIVALVSFGDVCAGDLPAVNIDVFSYIEWIINRISESSTGESACIKG